MNCGWPSCNANKPDYKAGGARAGAGRKKNACLVPHDMESDNSALDPGRMIYNYMYSCYMYSCC